MADPLDWITAQLAELSALGLERRPTVRLTAQSPRSLRLDDRELINFGSNDYLGLACSSELADAARESIGQFGWGAGASPLLGGRSQDHATLEQELASFMGCSAALVFPTGYAANVGCLSALVGPGDTVFSDQLNHASIIDGCRLSRAQVVVYPHLDMHALQRSLSEAPKSGRRLIVTDSLFSMHGDVASLRELADLAEYFDAMLMVDEAHATGVFGESGRGLCEQLNVSPHIHVGTLSKALGSHGGFVAGRGDLVQWLFNRARPYFFSTASPPAVAAATCAAIRHIRAHPQSRHQLLQLAETLRGRLHELGWSTGKSQSQIVPIMVGESDRAMKLSRKLLAGGVFAPGIRPPSVPAGDALLRISLTSAHNEDDIDRLLKLLGTAEQHRAVR